MRLRGRQTRMNAIVAFAQKVRADATLCTRMRAYAQANLSWEGVLRGVLERVSPWPMPMKPGARPSRM